MTASKKIRVSPEFDVYLKNLTTAINSELPPDTQISVIGLTRILGKANSMPTEIKITINKRKGRPKLLDLSLDDVYL